MQYVWVLPKGELEGDSVALIRTAGMVRTVFGSNADSKLIASGVADAITTPTLAITPANQRGFCRGRQLSSNVVDVDVYMRAHNQLSGIESVLASPCASSASSSSSTYSDEEGTIALPAGLMSDEQVSAASECLDYKGNISDIPAVMLYDFCNAFPTLLHEWMWLVLNVLRIPKHILKVIKCL